MVVTGPRRDQCIIWPFSRDRNGYALMRIKARSNLAHRYICEKANGPQPFEGSVVRHQCGSGNLGCVNPAHLVWGTMLENQKDRLVHDTHNRGERHGLSKLRNEEAIEISRRAKAGESSRYIASEFGISRATVRDIAAGRSWSWLSSEETENV